MGLSIIDNWKKVCGTSVPIVSFAASLLVLQSAIAAYLQNASSPASQLASP